VCRRRDAGFLGQSLSVFSDEVETHAALGIERCAHLGDILRRQHEATVTPELPLESIGDALLHDHTRLVGTEDGVVEALRVHQPLCRPGEIG
jgi:hypothetical protein